MLEDDDGDDEDEEEKDEVVSPGFKQSLGSDEHPASKNRSSMQVKHFDAKSKLIPYTLTLCYRTRKQVYLAAKQVFRVSQG